MARPGPALFELIRGSSAPPGVPARSTDVGKPPPPLVRITPKPGVVQHAEPPPPVAEPKPAAQSDRAWAAWSGKGSWLDLRRTVTIPMSTALFVIAGAVVVLVVIWTAAYVVGKGRGEEKIKRDLGLTAKPETIPLNQNLVTNPPKAPEPKATVEPRPNPTNPTPPPPAATGSEPRIAGMNYYLLASGLDRDGAEKMAEFLSKNGLPSAAAVDKPSGGSNNRGSYLVYVTKGLTPEEYKQGDRYAPRAEVMGRAATLGKIWQKDHKGQTDFGQAYWQKFKG